MYLKLDSFCFLVSSTHMLMGGGVIGHATEYISRLLCRAVKSMLVVKFVCILEVCHHPVRIV